MYSYAARLMVRSVAPAATACGILASEKTCSTVSSRVVQTTTRPFVTRLQTMTTTATQPFRPSPSSLSTRRLLTSGTPVEKTTTTATSASTAATSATKVSTSSSGGFVQWYEGHLQAHPVPTKMVTGCCLWGLGDAVGQIVPQLVGEDKNKQPMVYDWPRTGRAVLFGFALHAPTSHVHYNFLEWVTNYFGYTGLARPIFKAFMEQFVYWSWISNSMYHGFMGAMQGMNPGQIYDYIAAVLWDTQKAQWAFWIPVQLLNFQYIPVRHQLNVVLMTSIVWTALLSAWYPPQDDEKKKKQVEPN